MNQKNDSGEKISKIIPAADQIAFQASLFALSAAVEAAAAEHSAETTADVARVRRRKKGF